MYFRPNGLSCDIFKKGWLGQSEIIFVGQQYTSSMFISVFTVCYVVRWEEGVGGLINAELSFTCQDEVGFFPRDYFLEFGNLPKTLQAVTIHANARYYSALSRPT